MNTRKCVAKLCRLTALLLIIGYSITQSLRGSDGSADRIPDKPERICPPLIGEPLPNIILKSVEDTPVDLNAAIAFSSVGEFLLSGPLPLNGMLYHISAGRQKKIRFASCQSGYASYDNGIYQMATPDRGFV